MASGAQSGSGEYGSGSTGQCAWPGTGETPGALEVLLPGRAGSGAGKRVSQGPEGPLPPPGERSLAPQGRTSQNHLDLHLTSQMGADPEQASM